METSGVFSAECHDCGRKAGPSDSAYSLYAEWYGLIPARTAFEDMTAAMRRILLTLADSEYCEAKDLISNAENEAVGRRALNILDDCGLIRGKYVVDGTEASIEDAHAAKKDGKKVKVYFRRSFKREPLDFTIP